MKGFSTKIAAVVLLFGSAARACFAATLFSDSFTRPDGLVTNEFAYFSPTNASAVVSPDWALDSGSFFIQGNAGWSGVPDDCSNESSSPNAQSTNCTNSAVFRLNTKRFDFNNVKVAFSLYSNGLSSAASTPPVAWDGIHIFLRYQSEFQLYYASINRRDQTSVLKKKCPGGTDNGGTYYELTPYVPHVWSPGSWQHVYATVQTNADNTVTIALYDDNGLVVQGIDTNIGKCAPITSPGAVGIRGDNNNFRVDDFTVTDLSTSTVANPVPALSNVSPASASAGGAGFNVTVNGGNFMNGSEVLWNGQVLPTTFVNAGQLTAAVPAASIASSGSITITVLNPAPGGGTSSGQTLTIDTLAAGPPIIRHLSVSPIMPVNAVIQADTQNVSVLHWQFTPRNRSGSPMLAKAGAGASDPAGAKLISTTLPVLSLQGLALQTGDYGLDVTAENIDGILSAPTHADITLVAADLNGVRVFPNPWRMDKHSASPQITFDHLTEDSIIKIFTISGHLVKELAATASEISWDLTTNSVDRVGSGLYIYSITNSLGQQSRGKLAVIR